jgi:hypothetical protein
VYENHEINKSFGDQIIYGFSKKVPKNNNGKKDEAIPIIKA